VSPKLPVVISKELVRVVERLGFEHRRQTGSHAIYVRPTDRARVVIPIHARVALKPKTLRGIIRDLKLTVEELTNLL